MPLKEELSVINVENVVRSLFMSLSDDRSLTSDEFLLDWQERCLGSSLEGVILFHHLDVDKNGHIEDTDIPWVLTYFDRNCKSPPSYHYIIHLIRIQVTLHPILYFFLIKKNLSSTKWRSIEFKVLKLIKVKKLRQGCVLLYDIPVSLA